MAVASPRRRCPSSTFTFWQKACRSSFANSASATSWSAKKTRTIKATNSPEHWKCCKVYPNASMRLNTACGADAVNTLVASLGDISSLGTSVVYQLLIPIHRRENTASHNQQRICHRSSLPRYLFFATGWRKSRSTLSLGSVLTGPSRQSQRIISGMIAPPNFWPCRFMPHE